MLESPLMIANPQILQRCRLPQEEADARTQHRGY